MTTDIDLAAVMSGYLNCAIWTTTDEFGESFEGQFTVDDITQESVNNAYADVAAFVDSNCADLIRYLADLNREPESIGHDFWLTRNRHGAGFWDRSYNDAHVAYLARLSDNARIYGSAYLQETTPGGSLEISG